MTGGPVPLGEEQAELLRQMCTDAQHHRAPNSWCCSDCRGPRANEMCDDHRADLERAEAYVRLRIAILGPPEVDRILAESWQEAG